VPSFVIEITSISIDQEASSASASVIIHAKKINITSQPSSLNQKQNRTKQSKTKENTQNECHFEF